MYEYHDGIFLGNFRSHIRWFYTGKRTTARYK